MEVVRRRDGPKTRRKNGVEKNLNKWQEMKECSANDKGQGEMDEFHSWVTIKEQSIWQIKNFLLTFFTQFIFRQYTVY